MLIQIKLDFIYFFVFISLLRNKRPPPFGSFNRKNGLVWGFSARKAKRKRGARVIEGPVELSTF